MKTGRLPRRMFLRGLGGATMALPFLEYFAPARAQDLTSPMHYAFLFAGFSIGSYGNDKIAPASEGAWNGSVTRALQPLLDFGVSDVVSLVSGLEIPVGETSPRAGRPAPFHSTSHQVLATGQRHSGSRLPAPSSDQVAATVLAEGTPFPVLTYRAQPVFYYPDMDGITDGIISARINGDGDLEQVPPIASPRVAFESLFAGFEPPDPADAAVAARMLAMRRSVVDRVAGDAQALIGRLGVEDRVRMERHFDELRALENQLDTIEPPSSSTCVMPMHPGDDPPIGDIIDPSGEGSGYLDKFKNSSGYSNEELRASVMTDLITMAFACDLSRVTSFMLTYAQCFMNMYTLLNMPSDLHEITHFAFGGEEVTQDSLADCAAWHVKHFARLVQKLRDTTGIDGAPLLDSTGLVLAFEGGWGFDLESGDDSSPHSTQNMVMLVGGRAGNLHMTPGRHIRAQGVHPTAVLNTVLQAVGVDQTLGEVPDTVPALFG